MRPCCEQFEAHAVGTSQDGFRISWSLWELPYSVVTVRLLCEITDGQNRSLEINFCPWCGHDLKGSEQGQKD